MSKMEYLPCLKCGKKKREVDYYKSYSSLHSNGKIPYCKSCLNDMVDPNNVETAKETLRMIDRPFILSHWRQAVFKNPSKPFGNYMKVLNLKDHRELTWEDSQFIMAEKDDKEDDNEIKNKNHIEENDNRIQDVKTGGKARLQEKISSLTEKEIQKLENKWGYDYYSLEELLQAEKKYESLVSNYPVATDLHAEHLKSYCIYKVRSEMETSKGNFKEAREWAKLAQTQGEIAKININKLTKSDLSQGLDGFSQLARMVEQAVDIVPILPKFIEKPQDKIDYAIWCYVNYERKLHGLPEVEYSDIYDFYNAKLEESLDNTKQLQDYVEEIEIEHGNSKKKILTIDYKKLANEKIRENPNDNFLKNLVKWVELISFLRFYPDLFYDLITPKEGGIRLDADQRILMRCLARFPKNMGVFSRGYGKCVVGDSLLFTDQGIKQIGEFFNFQDDDIETYTSHEINLLNRFGELETSKKGVYSGLKQTKKITTEEGYEIETTLVHPLLVINENGDLEWKKAQDIEVGDYLPINRENDIWGNKTEVTIDMENWLNTFNKSSRWKIERSKCNIITDLDEELALIMGYLVGDGCMTTHNSVLFTNKDDDIIRNYTSFMKNRLNVKINKKTDIDYVVLGMYTREYFRQLGLKQVNAFNKKIPQCILDAPKNIVASFIRGLFDTDGGLSNSYIEFCTASEKMSKQLQTLLLNFGIISTRTKKLNKKFGTYSFRICIYSKNMNVFLDKIGFGCERKQARLIELCLKKRNPNKDIVPYQINKLKSYYEQAKHKNKALFKSFSHILTGENQLTYERLDKILNINKAKNFPEYEHLSELKDLNYFYSKVKSIEDGENHVYDLQMTNTESFISNGFVSHNTLLELMSNYHACIFYPNIEITMTAQTKENAANLVKEKWKEISRFYPMINDEMDGEPRISKDKAEVRFKNGSWLDTLANAQGSKGARRKRITIEESAQTSKLLFEDVLEPVVNIPRRTIGKMAIVNPYELNGQINSFTTSYFRGVDEYEKNVSMVQDMINLKGTISLGASWMLPCEFGRGELKSQILDKKEKISATFFATNYESVWPGSSEGALVSMTKLMNLRTLSKAELEAVKDGEYVISVDVARSTSTNNNQCSLVVLKVIRSSTGKLKEVDLVNIINIPSILNFKAQAQTIMKVRNLYNAKHVIVDSNGLGKVNAPYNSNVIL